MTLAEALEKNLTNRVRPKLSSGWYDVATLQTNIDCGFVDEHYLNGEWEYAKRCECCGRWINRGIDA